MPAIAATQKTTPLIIDNPEELFILYSALIYYALDLSNQHKLKRLKLSNKAVIKRHYDISKKLSKEAAALLWPKGN